MAENPIGPFLPVEPLPLGPIGPLTPAPGDSLLKGGSGQVGRITLQDNTGEDQISLSAGWVGPGFISSTTTISVGGKGQTGSISLSADDGQGQGVHSHLWLWGDGSAQFGKMIKLTGADGSAQFGASKLNANGSAQFGAAQLGADGSAQLTSLQCVGNILLFKDASNLDPAAATIMIDATKGDIILQNADCAEEFDLADATAEVEPGTVMVLAASGTLRPSESAYDHCVAGVVAGGGDYKPGIVLDRKRGGVGRRPIAVVGKAYCKVDADYGPIEVGSLLTTSPTLGHAMRAVEPLKAFGAVLGKALCPLEAGKGLIPMLIALQ